ncbi:MAG: DUF1552 domain-containing protein [Planctomycetia bacterium]
MNHRIRFRRRSVLRGIGAAVGLPWLESLAVAGAGSPRRLAFIYVPNGIDMPRWRPAAEGPLPADLPPILAPLDSQREKILVISGLAADKARAHGDGVGDHARAMAAFLTGAHPRKTDGTNILAGISADQVAAGVVGEATRLPSLELGCEPGGLKGACDSGYACVYSWAMSWKSASQPLPMDTDPRLAFERLFGAGSSTERRARESSRRSLIDVVREDARGLERSLGTIDRRKIDEYFTSLREVERRLDGVASRPVPVPPTGVGPPPANPTDLGERARLMCDVLAIAFQSDATRVCTLSFAGEGSMATYPQIDVNDGHHELSHHAGDAAKMEKVARINSFHVGHLAHLLDRLAAVEEAGRPLLENCMIAYGSGTSDGNRHNHDDLPILVAGGGCGTIRGGRHLRLATETPVANLWLSLLHRMGVECRSFGDSTGPLDGIC